MEPTSIIEVSPEQLKARLDRGDDVVVVDLRQAWEYHAGHIPSAVSLFIERYRCGSMSCPLMWTLSCSVGMAIPVWMWQPI
jgi:rhodanese-related sulfurtransferase